jgi:hypothetical protein
MSSMIGNGDLDAELFLDRSDPGNVGVVRVDRQAEQLGVHRLEFIGMAGKAHELGGADRGEVGRVGEEDEPFAPIVGQ